MLDFECPSMWMTPLDNYPMSVLETEEADKFMEATFFYDAELKPSQQTDGFAEATLTALETGELTPLVKEELKYTIQSRRLANGQSELGVEFTEPEQGQVSQCLSIVFIYSLYYKFCKYQSGCQDNVK